MFTALFFAGMAVGIIRYVIKHESKPIPLQGYIALPSSNELVLLDGLVEIYGTDPLPVDWADVYVNGERPLSAFQVREMLSYYR